MMVLSALRPDASLPEFLAHRARVASVRRLQIDLLVGIVVGAGELWLRNFGWMPVAAVALCLVCYAVWGLLDRLRQREQTKPNVLGVVDALCALAAAAGIVAAAGVLLSIWALALGTWIS